MSDAPSYAMRRSKVFSSARSSSSPAIVLSRRAIALRPSRRRVRDLVVEVGALEQAPADAGVGRAARAGQAAGGRSEGAREAGPDDLALFRVERVAVGRADGLVDGALHAGLGPEGDVAEIGMVDVAGEQHDRGRRLAALAGADLFEQLAQALEGELEGGPVVEVDGPPQLLAAARDRAAPGAVAEALVPGLEVVEAGGEQVGDRGRRAAGGRSRRWRGRRSSPRPRRRTSSAAPR